MIASRREIRVFVVQTLFEHDFHNRTPDAKVFVTTFNTLVQEDNPELVNNAFAVKLLEGIAAKYDDINDIIEQAAPNWSLEKMGSVDRNILRLGVFELLFGKEFDVPGRVALNEAIEITKLFLNSSARKFINGVLGAVYLEVKDPDEEEHVERKVRVKKSVGGVVFTITDDGILQFALVHDIFGRWTLSKGGIENGETDEGGFCRVIKDEIGIDIQPLEIIGANSYVAHPPEGAIRKEVTYFLGQAADRQLQLKDTEGLDDVQWFSADEVHRLTLYPDLKQIIFDGIQRAQELQKGK